MTKANKSIEKAGDAIVRLLDDRKIKQAKKRIDSFLLKYKNDPHTPIMNKYFTAYFSLFGR